LNFGFVLDQWEKKYESYIDSASALSDITLDWCFMVQVT